MNSNGQLLLYDALLAFLLIFVFLAAVIFVIGGMDDVFIDSNEALDDLELLSSVNVHGSDVLSALAAGDVEAGRVVLDVLSGRSFVLRDVSSGRVLLEGGSGGATVVSARKIVGGREFELILFS